MKVSRQDDCQFFGDLGRDLLEQNENKKETNDRIPPCLRIIVSLMSVPLQALIDSGSQITAISEEFYNYLLLHGKLTELPVSNVMLFTAIGKKSTTIKKQILCDVNIDGQNIGTSFLVVPHLSSQIILGNDWLLQNKVIINYEKSKMIVNGLFLSDSVVKFGKCISAKIKCSRDHDDITYIQVIDDSIKRGIFRGVGEKGLEGIEQLSSFSQIYSCINDIVPTDSNKDDSVSQVLENRGDIECQKISCQFLGFDCPKQNSCL